MKTLLPFRWMLQLCALQQKQESNVEFYMIRKQFGKKTSEPKKTHLQNQTQQMLIRKKL